MPDEIPQPTHREYLARRFQDICNSIAQRYSNPDMAQELQGVVRSMLALGHGFDEIPTTDSLTGPYSVHRNASDAAVVHLRTTTPLSIDREQLLTAILAGGWGIGEARRELKGRIAIGYSIKRTKRIIEIDGMVALPEQLTPEGLPKTL